MRLKPLIVLAALSSAGCSAGPAYVVSPPPHDYRQIVADGHLAAVLRAKPSFGPLTISGLQRSVLGEPGDWRTCIRATKSGRSVYYAIFFVGEGITDERRSVAIDRCEEEPQFLALPPRSKPKLWPVQRRISSSDDER